MKFKNMKSERTFNRFKAAHILTYTSEHEEDIDNIVKAVNEYEGLKQRIKELEHSDAETTKAYEDCLEREKELKQENEKLEEKNLNLHKYIDEQEKEKIKLQQQNKELIDMLGDVVSIAKDYMPDYMYKDPCVVKPPINKIRKAEQLLQQQEG